MKRVEYYKCISFNIQPAVKKNEREASAKFFTQKRKDEALRKVNILCSASRGPTYSTPALTNQKGWIGSRDNGIQHT